jgi:hypothetical protein
MTTAFVFGFVVGGFVFWYMSVAVERFRRARWDFNATRRGLRSLIEMMWARGVQAVKGCLVAAAVIVTVVLVWHGHHYR